MTRNTPLRQAKGRVRGVIGWFKAPGKGLTDERSEAHVYTYRLYLKTIERSYRHSVVFVPMGKPDPYGRKANGR